MTQENQKHRPYAAFKIDQLPNKLWIIMDVTLFCYRIRYCLKMKYQPQISNELPWFWLQDIDWPLGIRAKQKHINNQYCTLAALADT